MFGNITSNAFSLGLGFYIGKNYHKEVGTLFKTIKNSEEPPVKMNKEGIKIFGVTIIKYD